MNICIMTGRMTKDVELTFTSGSGTAVGKFSIAVQRDLKDKTTGKYESDFINCIAWSKTAEFIANYTEKGKLVEVAGRWEHKTFTKQDGSKGYSDTLIVEKFKPLEWGDKQSNTDNSTDGFVEVTDGEIPFK